MERQQEQMIRDAVRKAKGDGQLIWVADMARHIAGAGSGPEAEIAEFLAAEASRAGVPICIGREHPEHQKKLLVDASA